MAVERRPAPATSRRPRPPLDVPVIYPSTDYVFDGTHEEGYVESDEVGPLSAYGRSKLAGEVETAAANPRHFIVRASWLFGVSGRNFVDTMLRPRRATTDEVVVVRDQVGCPTYTGHLAAGTRAPARRRGLRHPPHGRRRACSWYEFARRDLPPGRVELPRAVGDQRHARPARRRGRAFSVLVERARAPDPAARLAKRAWPRLPRRAGARCARMKVLVTGGAGFIGSNFVRHFARRASGRQRRRARQADLRGADRRRSRT